MQKMVLLKLAEPVEKKTCIQASSLPHVTACHPLQGDYDLLVILNGEPEDLEIEVGEIEKMENLDSIQVHDEGELDIDKPMKIEGKVAKIKTGPRGHPFIICPHCGNESQAMCSDCGNALFPSAACPECRSHNYRCAACGRQMKHVS